MDDGILHGIGIVGLLAFAVGLVVLLIRASASGDWKDWKGTTPMREPRPQAPRHANNCKAHKTNAAVRSGDNPAIYNHDHQHTGGDFDPY